MTFLEIIVIFFIALFVAVIFTYIFKNKNPWSFFLFFLIIFLASWTAQLWIVPIGPSFLGVSWIPILIVGVFFAYILSLKLAKPVNARKEIIEKQVGVETDEDKTSIAFGAIFWVLLLILTIAIIIGYGIQYLP